MSYLHRDDIPFQRAEEIEKQLKKQHPDSKVIFAGDTDIPYDVRVAIERAKMRMQETLILGSCLECEEIIDGYIDMMEKKEAFKLPDGWSMYTNGVDGEPSHLLCPKCSEETGKEKYHVIKIKREKGV